MKKIPDIYIISSFVAGFALMVVELIATRIMAPYVGASIYTWTSVIGVVLLGMSIGNYVGGRYVDRVGSRKALARLFAMTAITTSLIPVVAFFSPVVALSGLPMAGITILLAALLFLVPAIFFGTLYPGILKLYLENVDQTGTKSGQISATWSLGSIIGTFLTGFYFVGYLGSVATVFLASILLLVNAAALHGFKKRTVVMIVLLFSMVGVMAFIMHLFTDVRGAVFASESGYYKIRVVDRDMDGMGRVRALFLDADSHSMEGLDGQRLGIYPEIYPVFPAMNGNIKSVLVLGGGAYSLSKNIASAYEGVDVTTVEIDPEVQRVAEDYFRLKEYPVRTVIGDGRVFLQRSDKKYDLIFSDAYNSFISVPWHMATQEFTREVKGHLNEGGIYAVNFSSAKKGENALLFQSMEKTFGSVFGNYYVFAYGDDEYEPQNIILVGVSGGVELGVEELRERIKQVENGEFLAKRLGERSRSYTGAPVLTDVYAPVERLMVPLLNDYFGRYIAFYYTMLLEGDTK